MSRELTCEYLVGQKPHGEEATHTVKVEVLDAPRDKPSYHHYCQFHAYWAETILFAATWRSDRYDVVRVTTGFRTDFIREDPHYAEARQ